MKKVILLLLGLMLIPFGVDAMAVSETFNLRDDVSINLYGKEDTTDLKGIGGHVIAESKAGDTTVTILLDMVIGQDIFDSEEQDGHTLTNVFEKAYIKTVLTKYAQEKGWVDIAESRRLLSTTDLTNLGITKNDKGVYEILGKNSFAAPIYSAAEQPFMYNYWTQITEGENAVYVAKYKQGRTGNGDNDVWATIEAEDITAFTEAAGGSKYAIRPVITIDKKWILCNNSKTPNVPEPQKPDSPKTGVEDIILPLAGILLGLGTIAVVTSKKNLFKQI